MFCTNCGTQYEGNFCPSCGAKAAAPAQEAPVVESPVVETPVKQECASATACAAAPVCCEKANKAGMSKAMNIVAKSLAFFGAAMAFIFMFLIGFKYVAEMWGMKEEETVVKNLFWYLSDNIKDFSKTIDMMKLYQVDDYELVSYIMTTLLGFFIALTTLILVVVFAIIAIVKFATSFSKDNDTVKASFKVMLAYVLGTSLLYAITFAKESGYGEMAYTFNGATITGLVFCTIAIVGTIVCKLIENPANFKAKNFLANKIVGLVAVAVSLAVLIIALNTGVAYKGDGEKYNSNPLFAMESDETVALGVIAAILMIVAVIFFVLSLFRNASNVISKKPNASLGWAIVALILSTLAAIFMLATAKALVEPEGGFGFSEYKADMGKAIVLIVFSLLNLGATIASKVIYGKNQIEE